jgi:hypothetical protein
VAMNLSAEMNMQEVAIIDNLDLLITLYSGLRIIYNHLYSVLIVHMLSFQAISKPVNLFIVCIIYNTARSCSCCMTTTLITIRFCI